ncbi:LOW QUALITY PROTEIN: hypothetical protein Cgig2_011849 [Carnegiea gigantea]|uniref:Uncharacterized protein n=1 Tax=Carnegiea gigantea TaxID=171969 RepID=A0A9Q1JRN6_9CARY|nr:LOW QUALITY PROTEIN: hypothetical protein Cgig2_011849 [Carnegiea gigantea]
MVLYAYLIVWLGWNHNLKQFGDKQINMEYPMYRLSPNFFVTRDMIITNLLLDFLSFNCLLGRRTNWMQSLAMKIFLPIFRNWRLAQLIETIVQLDDQVTKSYLEGNELDEATIKDLIRTWTILALRCQFYVAQHLETRGFCLCLMQWWQPLLDVVVDFLPSPIDLPPMKGTDPENPDVFSERQASDDEPFAGLAFKIMSDPFVGSLFHL